MNCLSQSKNWFLSSYSRFKPNKNLQIPGETIKSGCNGDWTTEERNNKTNLRLSLTCSGHMVIHKNETILENVFIPFNSNGQSSYLKVLKNDTSLVFLHNFNCETRIFRIQFLPSEASAIQDCADSLAKYFTVRSSNEKHQTSESSQESSGKKRKNKPEARMPFTVLTSKIIQNKVEDLPKIYHRQAVEDEMQNSDANENFEKFLCLCLADPIFPSYVAKVEKTLKKMTEDEEMRENQDNC